MSEIKILKVNNDKDLMRFIKLPWSIYKDDPNWVPHLIMDSKHILDKKKSPFFEHGEADYFLAEKDGVLVGRIAAIKNDLHNQIHKDKKGFFGFFECINDQQVANKLFDTAKDWLVAKGFDSMMGPASPSSNDEWGMLLDGFNDPPRILMSYNPSYYNDLCNNYGMFKEKDLNAYKLENKKVGSSEKLTKVAKLAKERSRLKIVPLNMKNFKGEIEKVKYLYNKAWAPNWGFVPLTDGEIDAMARDLKSIVEPSLVLFGEIDDKVIGFALVLLDYNQILINVRNGKLLPFNFLKLFTQKKNITWSRVVTLGVIPEFQKKGLDAVFYWEITNRAHALGIDLGEASWILEDNEMMNRGALVMKGDLYKKYRIWGLKF